METETRVERRKHKRYKMPDDVYTISNNSVAYILEISAGGFSARYIDSDCCAGKESLATLIANSRTHLNNLPIKIVWVGNHESPPFSTTTTQRVGVQFQDLAEQQRDKVEMFITRHRV